MQKAFLRKDYHVGRKGRIYSFQMEQAEKECANLGANAVLGVRIETNSTFEGTVDMVLYGTAVWAKK